MTWRFWRIGISFLLVFLLCNVLTEWHEFDALGITLWSPDNGLSLALLIESIAFARLSLWERFLLMSLLSAFNTMCS